MALLGTLEILVPMAGLIDPKAELERLAKRERKAQTDLDKLEAKLANADFARKRTARGGGEGSIPSCRIAHRNRSAEGADYPGERIAWPKEAAWLNQ